MKLTAIDRLERMEDIIQEKILHTESELESIAHLKDACMARIRIMYLMDLGQLRNELITVRRKVDLEYAIRGKERTPDDEIRRAEQGADLGGKHEADLQRGDEEPGGGARRRGRVRPVGGYDPHFPPDDGRNEIRDEYREGNLAREEMKERRHGPGDDVIRAEELMRKLTEKAAEEDLRRRIREKAAELGLI